MGLRKGRRGAFVRKTLAILGLLAFCFAVALPLYADAPNGKIEALSLAAGGAESGRASDIDTWEALNAPGLDLRDAQNRKISRDAIEKDLRSATKADAHRAAELSALKFLKDFVDFLERGDLLESGLRAGEASERRTTALAVTLRRRIKKSAPVWNVAFGPSVVERPWTSVGSPLQLTTSPGRVRVLNRLE